MAKVVRSLCDKHLHEGDEIAGDVEVKITIGHAEYVMDLCKDDHDDWWGPFADMIKEIGVRPGSAPRRTPRTMTGGEHECPLGDRSYKQRSSLVSHVRTTHHEWAQTEQGQAFLEDRRGNYDGTPRECPITGCLRKVKGRSGEVQHVRQAHPDQYDEWLKSSGNSDS